MNANGEFTLSLSTANSTAPAVPEEEECLAKTSGHDRPFVTPASLRRSNTKEKAGSIKFSANDFVTQHYGDCFEQHYEMIECLGGGAYGEVYVCQHKETGARRAVKLLQVDSEEDAETVRREFLILKEVDHPNLMKVYQLFEDFEESGQFYIVSDLYEGGELYDEIERWGYFNEDDAAVLINQVLGCLNYCHAQGIAHRDLKPENILLDDTDMHLDDLKIIDFGLAAVFDDYDTAEFEDRVGSSYYIAPEIFSGEHGPKVDIWATGIILFILLCGEAPFDGDDDVEIMEAIYEGDYSFEDNEVWEEVSDQAKDFVSYLLTYDADERPTAEEALQHPWLEDTRRRSTLAVQKRASQKETSYLANLETFRADSKLKQAVCAFIGCQLVLKHEKDVMDELFRCMDSTSIGQLSKQDLKTGFADFLGRHLTDQQVDDIFQRVNYSCSGAIEYSEFIVACLKLDESRLQAAFNEFDKRSAGVLTAEDLMQVLDLQDYNNDDAEACVDKILKQIDLDDKGFISFEDFKNAMIPAIPTQRTSRRVSTLSALSGSSNHSICSSRSRRSTVRRSTQIFFDDEAVIEARKAVEEDNPAAEGENSQLSPVVKNNNKKPIDELVGFLHTSLHKARMGRKMQSVPKNMSRNPTRSVSPGPNRNWSPGPARSLSPVPRRTETTRNVALPRLSSAYSKMPGRVLTSRVGMPSRMPGSRELLTTPSRDGMLSRMPASRALTKNGVPNRALTKNGVPRRVMTKGIVRTKL